MDKKLLNALNNLSLALEGISEALSNKSESSSATAKALQGGDFISEIKEINIGVKSLQKDTKQILENQQTIMKMAQSKSNESKTSDVENLGKDKTSQKNFKDGIGFILLIAVAVVALGTAFNLISSVDFLSVITLSLVIPLLAIGFSKVIKTLKEVGFDPKLDGKNFILAVSTIALSITMVSWILQMIIPLSLTKALTATFIALTFAMLAPSINSFMLAFKGLTWSEIARASVSMVIVLPSMALGLAMASWALSLTKPIEFSQFLTAVGISLAFVVISYGLRKMLKSFEGLRMEDISKSVLFLPLILPAVALGIALSSYAFQLIKPVESSQMFTAVFMSIAFTVISYGLNKILTSFKDVTPGQAIAAAIMIPILFVGISYAISYSSVAFAQIVPIKFDQFLTAVGIAAVFVVISVGLKLITNAISKLNWKDVLLIPALFTVMSIAITASSYILSKAKEIKSEVLMSILGFSIVASASIVIIAGAIWAINKMGISIDNAIRGGIVIVAISAAIMLSSLLLNLGNYKNYPDWKWSLGVAISLGAFGLGAVLLGTQVLNPLFYAGLGAILLVSGTIVATSFILNTGNYKSYPSASWSLGVGMTLASFGLGAVLLGTQVLNPLFYAGLGAILLVAGSIVAVSHIFKMGKFDQLPSTKWLLGASGILLSMGLMSAAFAAVSPLIIIGNLAILATAASIIAVDKIFSKGVFTFYPSKKWIDGTSLSLVEWSKIMDKISFTSVAGDTLSDFFGGGLMDVAESIIETAKIFSSAGNIWNNYPSIDWVNGISGSIIGFTYLTGNLDSKDGKSVVNVSKGIVKVAGAYDRLAKAIKQFSTAINGLDTVKINSFRSLTGNLALLSAMDSNMFSNMMQVIEARSGVFANLLKSQSDEVEKSPNVKVSGVRSNVQSRNSENIKDSKGEDQLQKLDKVITLLNEMTRSTKSIDEHLQNPKRKNADIGRGD